jgi:peroxiredoxin
VCHDRAVADDFLALPPGLPRPLDDGAARHLAGATVPDLPLPSTGGDPVSLARAGRALVVVFPWAARPGEPLPDERWDAIPGARGCTPELCGVRDRRAGLEAAGLAVYGVSAQSPRRLHEVAGRLGLAFPLLSDAEGRLAGAMRLPIFEAGGRRLLRRLTMLVGDGVVERVWYPVFPPDRHAEAVLAELTGPGGA